MARPKPHSSNLRAGRHSQPGTFYFLTTTVADRRQIFTNPKRASIVLDAIRWLHTANRFYVDAAVLMPDHLHIVGQLRNSTLARMMHTLKSYTANCLVASGVDMPVWQDGYHDHGLRDDEDYRGRARYVLQNPVRAGLARQVDDYPFLILPAWWKEPALDCGEK